MDEVEELTDFLFANNWFQEKYAQKGEPGKFPTFKAALNLFMQNEGEIIVETGCIRMKDDWGAGYSTYLFGDFCRRYNKRLFTCDINTKNLATCMEITEEFRDNITYIYHDSIDFLKNFKGKIDLLYLDSMDCCEELRADNTEPQKHQCNELRAALDKLSDKSVVLLDDCIFKNGGKCKLTREFLLDNGFVLILEYYQSLWMR